ncbi:hypothetical protein FKM82_008199 [Ascaphus truei]
MRQFKMMLRKVLFQCQGTPHSKVAIGTEVVCSRTTGGSAPNTPRAVHSPSWSADNSSSCEPSGTGTWGQSRTPEHWGIGLPVAWHMGPRMVPWCIAWRRPHLTAVEPGRRLE